MTDYAVIGFVIAAVSAFFNGSFPAWQKINKDEVDSVVFNGIVGFGAFVSSMIVPLLFWEPYNFYPAAMVGGVLLIGATLCTFIAVPKLGLGIACATWSCVAIFVSFLWGVIGPSTCAECPAIRADVKNWPMSLLSLLCLAVGAVIIVSADAISQKLWGEAKGSLPLTSEDVATTPVSGKDHAIGLIFALGTGLFGGSILVPMHFVPKDVPGIQTVVSFGVGALVASLVTTAVYWKLVAKQPGLPSVTGRTLLAGLLSGFTWNAGNVCQIVVQSDPINLTYGIAYPINQCGMLFAGLWGVLVFREITGKSIGVFWAGAAVLVVGVILLGLYGPGA